MWLSMRLVQSIPSAHVKPFSLRTWAALKNAIAASKMAGVKHFIFISSLSVITGQGDQFNVDESAPLRPCGESYADSKIEAEKSGHG